MAFERASSSDDTGIVWDSSAAYLLSTDILSMIEEPLPESLRTERSFRRNNCWDGGMPKSGPSSGSYSPMKSRMHWSKKQQEKIRWWAITSNINNIKRTPFLGQKTNQVLEKEAQEWLACISGLGITYSQNLNYMLPPIYIEASFFYNHWMQCN